MRRDENGEIILKGHISWQESQDIQEVVCTELCKYPSEYKDPDDMEKEQCSICPLAEKLMEFEDD